MKVGSFKYVNGVMCCNGIPISEILGKFPHEQGLTPAYVYDEESLRRNCREVRQAFGPGTTIRYATKACMNVHVLGPIHEEGFGFDVVSRGELGRVLLAGAEPSEIVYAGAAKTDSEIDEAVQLGVTMVVECIEELSVIEEVAERHGLSPRVLLRLRPNVDAHTHEKLTTGTAFSKFGMPESTVRQILCRQHDLRSDVVGLHFHIGSQIESPDCTVEALDVALPIIDEFGLTVLDIGGGFPVNYMEDGEVPSLQDFADAVFAAIGDRNLELIIEPGRSIVADTGILVTSVMSVEEGTHMVKDEDGEEREEKWRIATCDAGMADLIRAMLYDAYHQVWAVIAGEFVAIKTTLGGPYCESTDWLALARLNLPELFRGDLLVVMHAGAYGRAMASNYNGNLFAVEIMVMEDGTFVEIGERQDFDHSVALEIRARIAA